jgi:hypothetical protein
MTHSPTTAAPTRLADTPDLGALLPLDAAPATMYDAVAATRAEARLEQIVATPCDRVTELIDLPRHRPSRRTVALRWAAVPVVAAAGLVASVLLPGGVGVTPSVAAVFSTWTKAPAIPDAAQLAATDSVCRATIEATLAEHVQDPNWAGLHFTGATIDVAEQRGDWGLIAYTGAGGETATCLTTVIDGAPVVVQHDLTTYYDVNPFPEQPAQGPPAAPTAGSATPEQPTPATTPATATTPDPGDVGGPTSIMGNGVDGQAGGWGFADLVAGSPATTIAGVQTAFGALYRDQGFTVVRGVVGADVTGVAVHTGGLDIEATVANGQFIAWSPDPDTRSVPDDGFVFDGWSLTLTLADGTVIQQPTIRLR